MQRRLRNFSLEKLRRFLQLCFNSCTSLSMVFIAEEPPGPRAGAPGAAWQTFARALCTEEVRTPKAKPNWGKKLICFQVDTQSLGDSRLSKVGIWVQELDLRIGRPARDNPSFRLSKPSGHYCSKVFHILRRLARRCNILAPCTAPKKI